MYVPLFALDAHAPFALAAALSFLLALLVVPWFGRYATSAARAASTTSAGEASSPTSS